MQIPRIRLGIRGMMIAVAIAAVVCLGGREYWKYWLRQHQYYPLQNSRLGAGTPSTKGHIAGRPIPVTIDYHFELTNPILEAGTSCLMLAEVWFEDQDTGVAVTAYTLDALLTVGGREKASGTLTWDATIDRPGKYKCSRKLTYKNATGDWTMLSAGSHWQYEVGPATPPTPSGAKP